MKVTIKERKPFQARTVENIQRVAAEHGVYAYPVYNRRTEVDEVHLLYDGGVIASIFRPASGGLGVWRSNREQARVANVVEAVSRALKNRSGTPEKQPRLAA
jgi:hypothetical protein